MRCRSYKAVVAQLLLDGGKLASPGLSHRPASSKLAVSSRSQARASVSAAALLTLRSPQMPLAQTCLAQSRRSTQPGLYKSHAIVANSSLWIKKGTGGVRMPIPCRPSTLSLNCNQEPSTRHGRPQTRVLFLFDETNSPACENTWAMLQNCN